VGNAEFSASAAHFIKLAINNGTKYVAYYDASQGGKATVMKFDGANWVPVGSPGFSAGSTLYVSLAFDQGIPYVAHTHDDTENKVTVTKFGTNSVDLPHAPHNNTLNVTTPIGTNIESANLVTEDNLPTQDNEYHYPFGLANFSFTTDYTSNIVSLTFETDLQPNQITVRKYNPTTNTYNTIPDATVTSTTNNGKPALQISYEIIDNGALDIDPTPGAITDPVGIAIAEQNTLNTSDTKLGAPNTGFTSTALSPSIFAASTGLVILTYVARRYFRQIRRT